VPSSTRSPASVATTSAPAAAGKKYKKCHLLLERSELAVRRADESVHERDRRLVELLAGYAVSTFGADWFSYPEIPGADVDETLPLIAPCSVYHHEVDGKVVVDHYLERYGYSLSDADRAWIDAQRASWISVWESSAVEEGKVRTLRDLLTGETAEVRERRLPRHWSRAMPSSRESCATKAPRCCPGCTLTRCRRPSRPGSCGGRGVGFSVTALSLRTDCAAGLSAWT
jgi:hypothetical protein